MKILTNKINPKYLDYDGCQLLIQAIVKQAKSDLIESYKVNKPDYFCEQLFKDWFPDSFKKIISFCKEEANKKNKLVA